MKLSNMSKMFKALSNEKRLELFKMICEWHSQEEKKNGHSEYCAGIDKAFTKACCCMDLSKSTVSHHLKELQNAGLISITRNGQASCCKINADAIKAIKEFL